MSDLINTAQSTLFNRVITILEDARGNVVHAVNSNMVMLADLAGKLFRNCKAARIVQNTGG